jgi:hypothetical protein
MPFRTGTSAQRWRTERLTRLLSSSIYGAESQGGFAGYNLGMTVKPGAKPRGPWTAEEIARNERANKAQVAHDRARGVSSNLEEAVALSRFANRFSEAFRRVRRA